MRQKKIDITNSGVEMLSGIEVITDVSRTSTSVKINTVPEVLSVFEALETTAIKIINKILAA